MEDGEVISEVGMSTSSSKAVLWQSWGTSETNAGPSFPSTLSCPFGFSQLLGASLCPTLTSPLSLAQRGESPRCVQVSAKITVTQWLSVTGVQLLSSTLPFLLVLKGGTGRNRTWGPITEVPPLPSLRGNQCDVCAPKRVCSDPNLGPVQPQGVRARGISRKTISLTAAGDKLVRSQEVHLLSKTKETSPQTIQLQPLFHCGRKPSNTSWKYFLEGN